MSELPPNHISKAIRASNFCFQGRVALFIIDRGMDPRSAAAFLSETRVSSLSVRWGECESAELARVSGRLLALEQLQIMARKKMPPEGLCSFLAELPHPEIMERLELWLPAEEDIWLGVLTLLAGDLMDKLKELRAFRLVCSRGGLSGFEFPGELLRKVFAKLSQDFKSLEKLVLEPSLALGAVRAHPESSLFNLAIAAWKPQLQKLSMSFTLPPADLPALAEFISSASALRSLKLAANPAVLPLICCKGVSASIEHLSLESQSESDIGQDFFSSLHSHTIRKIVLRKVSVSPPGMFALLELLRTNPVSVLRFISCKKLAFAHSAFEQFCHSVGKLRKLSVSDCTFGPEFAFAELITAAKDLRKLCISDAGCDCAGVFASLESMQYLRSFSLFNRRMPPAANVYSAFNPPARLDYLGISFPILASEHYISAMSPFVSKLWMIYHRLALSMDLCCTTTTFEKFACEVLDSFARFDRLTITVSEDLLIDATSDVVDTLIRRAPQISVSKLTLSVTNSKIAENVFPALPQIRGLQAFFLEGCSVTETQLKILARNARKCETLTFCRCHLKLPNASLPSYLAVGTCLFQLS